jgi:hypothetical protein
MESKNKIKDQIKNKRAYVLIIQLYLLKLYILLEFIFEYNNVCN